MILGVGGDKLGLDISCMREVLCFERRPWKDVGAQTPSQMGSALMLLWRLSKGILCYTSQLRCREAWSIYFIRTLPLAGCLFMTTLLSQVQSEDRNHTNNLNVNINTYNVVN